MSTFPTAPATNLAEATSLIIDTGNRNYNILVGDINTVVETVNGDVPSIRKAIHEMAVYKSPLAWSNGTTQTDLLQPRSFNGHLYVPTTTPALMGVAPAEPLWALWKAAYVSIQWDDGVATEGQTSVTFSGMTYVPGGNNLSFYVNGSLVSPSNYTESNDTTIVLDTGMEAGDEWFATVNARAVSSDVFLSSNVTYTKLDGTTVNLDGFLHDVEAGIDVTSGLRTWSGTTDGTAYLEIIGANTDQASAYIVHIGSVYQSPETAYTINTTLERVELLGTPPATGIPWVVVGVGYGVGVGNEAVLDSFNAALNTDLSSVDYCRTLSYVSGNGLGGASFIKTGNTGTASTSSLSTGVFYDLAGNEWEFVEDQSFKASMFGATNSSDNSTSVNNMLTWCASVQKPCEIDVDSILTNITVPTYSDIKIRANITHSSTSTHCFNISNVDFVKIDFGMKEGFVHSRAGDKRFVSITGTSDYSNKHVELRNGDISGGTGTFIYWFACDKIWFIDLEIHDGDGSGIYSVSNIVSNPYKSKYVVFKGINNYDLGTSNTSHGLSINSWVFVENVWVTECNMSGIKNNPIEIWANKVNIFGNQILDGAIPISCGACHWLNVYDNQIDITTPATSGDGGYGIEIGACHFFNVHHNTIRGCRNGIRMTGSNINGGTAWYTTTELYSESGTLDPSDTNKLRVLSRDYASGMNFSGSYYGIVDSNIIVDCLNTGVYLSADYYNSRSVKLSNNLITRIGRYTTPTETLGAVALMNGRFDVDNNTIEDCLYYAIYNQNSRVILGKNTIKKVDASGPYGVTGVSASYNFTARQDFSECTLSGVATATTPTQGTWYVGDTLFNHAPAAGGSLGATCTTAGTQSTQLNSLTATTTSGVATVVLSSLGDIQIGNRITIAGVTGTKTVTEVTYNTNTITVDSNCDASVSGAAITNVAATFKAHPSLAA